ncbi:protocadherin beta-15 isoform X3 [Octopus vulgaris]|uniref:Protocadherin beta-15 isoform X3 n=1 Tax=Octopus vulgaris TaxID=6645 RepID=A0AA36BF02_OCTVU|nr:protocadherin beta-15 isoform X3 [Octopus vulgaris]
MLLVVIKILLFMQTCYCVDFIYYVKEGMSANTYLGDISVDTHMMDSIPVEDYKSISFSQLQKELTESSPLFNVTKAGKLYTAQTLDAEALCKYNTECFQMVDIAVRRRKSFVKILEIKVIIEDVNEHPPEFPNKTISIQFSERDGRGSSISLPNAVDKDVSVLNSQIIYHLIKKQEEPFKLDVSKRVDGSYSLRITLENKLDREMQDIYNLKVVAKDGGTPSKKCVLNVEITVSDVNDSPPVFSQNVYNVTVNKRQRNTPIITLSATDLDSGPNGNISYYFSSKTTDIAKSYFKLHRRTGQIYQHEDFSPEKKQTYKLFIEAKDGGKPPLSSIAMVLVNVINQQNNAPVIDINFSELTGNTATISEAMEVGSFIAYVKVVDNDIGLNGQVTCDLQHNKFTLQSLGQKRYKVSVKKAVDRETESQINFTISCKDKGFPSLKTERKFSIQVMDVNDVQPQFTKDVYKFLTYENEKPNFPVGFINATDPDLGHGGQLTFSLLNQVNQALPFKISNLGFITTTRSLDHEQQDVFKFRVLVKDNGNPQLSNTADVVIEVLDENDNPPYFTFPSVNPFSLDVYYNPQSKNDITVLKASDRDNRQNAFLKYEILEGNNRQLFAVNPYTGVLSFSRTVYQNDAGLYNLKFIVKDSGTPVLTAKTTLSMTLTVSNKTSTKMTAVQFQSNDKIHINLFIIIIVAAVTVSVLLVVSITVCIVRRNNQQKTHYKCGIDPSKKLVDKGSLSGYSCAKQVSSKHESPDVLLSIEKGEDPHLIWPRDNLSTRHPLCYDGKDTPIEIHCDTLSSGIHQHKYGSHGILLSQ